MNRKAALLSGAVGLACVASPLLAAKTMALPVSSEGMPTAFVVGPKANVIDLAGSWEVFSDTSVEANDILPKDGADRFGGDPAATAAFAPYVVSDTVEPLAAGGGLTIVPNFSFENAPRPRIIVMGAQTGHTKAKLEWIREMSRTADLVMSVCTGAFLLAATGLLDGKRATTHHDYYDNFASTYPKVTLIRGPRFVDEGMFKTAGGLTSGIELAIHVVEQYYGTPRADLLAHYLEYNRTSSRPS
jgi:transcriptional regulator GlxA family with amidase domain